MAVTQSQTPPGVALNFANGSYIESGTAAAIDIECGFKPRYVLVMNSTSRDQVEWFEGMSAGHGIKMLAAGTRSAITSNGITVDDRGFRIGLDTDVNVTAEQIRWVALG